MTAVYVIRNSSTGTERLICEECDSPFTLDENCHPIGDTIEVTLACDANCWVCGAFIAADVEPEPRRMTAGEMADEVSRIYDVGVK